MPLKREGETLFKHFTWECVFVSELCVYCWCVCEFILFSTSSSSSSSLVWIISSSSHCRNISSAFSLSRHTVRPLTSDWYVSVFLWCVCIILTTNWRYTPAVGHLKHIQHVWIIISYHMLHYSKDSWWNISNNVNHITIYRHNKKFLLLKELFQNGKIFWLKCRSDNVTWDMLDN